ncbi:MAG: hypothetical protein EP347_10130 [Alphaproteobacteria bacterium]|nr:MAG: hypothetical protein EP347_10130 [Alphaproteobacteria bacterium]
MNWQAIIAVSEVIGVLAVIVSLIYLATQIRQSNLAAQAAATDQITSRFINWMEMGLGDTHIKGHFLNGLKGLKGRSAVENMEFFDRIQNLFKIMEEIHFHRRRGFIEDDNWIGWRAWIANMKSYDVCQFFYDHKKSNFSPSFQAF